MLISENIQAQLATENYFSVQNSVNNDSRLSPGLKTGHHHARGAGHRHHDHYHRHHQGHKPSFGLSMFRQDMLASETMALTAGLEPSSTPYNQSPGTTVEVSEQVINAARLAISLSPGEARTSINAFRSSVAEVSRTTRESVQLPEMLDDTVTAINDGLTTLETQNAANLLSTSSITEANSTTSTRSVIKIRTQEGDLVKLNLRNYESLSATNTHETSGETESSFSDFSSISGTRLMLKVEGHLNDSELEAIENIFVQAEAIASEFFDGDLEAAFSLSQSLNVDNDQLATVKMRFGIRQYAEISRTAQTQPEAIQEPEAAKTSVTAPPEAGSPVPDTPVTVSAEEPTEKIASPVSNEEATEVTAHPVKEMSDFTHLWKTIATFLQSVNQGFTSNEENSSVRLHHTSEFKLKLFSSVVTVMAGANQATTIEQAIDTFPLLTEQDKATASA